MNIIKHNPAPAKPKNYLLEERHTTANGVERRVSVEAAGTDRDTAIRMFGERVTANPATYAPTGGIRLVLTGGGR